MNESFTYAERVDPFATFDAAYVLGALSPEDRAEFEQHLRHCDACARSVRELAGLPGLLAHVDAPHQLDPEPPPPELLPKLLARVRRQRRRGRILSATSVGVALAACVALVLALVLPGATEDPPGTEMTALGPYPVQATAAVTDASWGTAVDMSCSYRGGKGGDYALVAVREDGGVERLATWYAVPQETAEMSLDTRLRTEQIEALEIRLMDGRVLLRLPVAG